MTDQPMAMNTTTTRGTEWHTAGKWEASPYSSVVGCVVTAQPDPTKNAVRIAGVGGRTRQETEANARLISAACASYDKHCGPRAVECAEADLLGEALAALRNAERWLSEMHSETDDGTKVEMREIHSAAWEAIDKYRAVLAKATGGQR